MLPSTCSREALLACPPFPTWNLPSFTVESTLSTPCSALISLSLAKVRLLPPHDLVSPPHDHLIIWTLSPLMIWYSGQMALFLFFLAREAPAFLPTALSVALKPLFPFWQAQYVQVFPLKPAPFCMLFAGLGSTNKSAISLLFSFCPRHPVIFSIFFSISNCVANLSGTVFSLLLLYQTTMGPRTLVSPGERRG